MTPIKRSFDIGKLEFISIVNDNSKIIDISTCISNNEIKVLSHTLKKNDVLELSNEINAKGLINTKVCTIIYLKEYVNTKFNKPKVVNDLMIPSKEIILKSVELK